MPKVSLFKDVTGAQILLGVLFVGICVFYSTYKLTESPPTWFDEGIYIQVAQSLAETGTQRIQVAPESFAPTGQVTAGYPFLAPVALSLKLFGNSLLAARTPMVIFIVLCVLAAFVYIYRLYGVRDALLSLFLLSTFPLLYGNGKNVLGEVPGMLYLFLALYCIGKIEAQEFKGARWYVLAGLFVGLTAATKPVFFLFPLAIGIVFLLFIRRIPLKWKELGLATLACVAPLALWAYLQFDTGDAFTSIFAHYTNPYNESSLIHTAIQNLSHFFTESTPLYAAALMFIWIVAFIIRWYQKTHIALTEMIAFVFSLLIFATYLRTEGWYRYFFEGMTLALVFAPVSMRVIGQAFKERFALNVGVYVPLLLLALGTFQLYQLNFSSWVASHYKSPQTQLLQDLFASKPLEGSVLIYNAPEVVPFLQSTNYYQYFDIDPTGALAYGKENLVLLKQGVPQGVITTATLYAQHSALFMGYKEDGAAGSYLLLKRK